MSILMDMANPQFSLERITNPDGSAHRLVKPEKIYIDGAETQSSSATVEAGKMKVIAATFETDPFPGGVYNMFIICPIIRFFDSKGQPVFAVCKGWLSHRPTTATRGSIFWPPTGTDMPARLLPVVNWGSCQSAVRGS
jgi:hypothetical protein